MAITEETKIEIAKKLCNRIFPKMYNARKGFDLALDNENLEKNYEKVYWLYNPYLQLHKIGRTSENVGYYKSLFEKKIGVHLATIGWFYTKVGYQDEKKTHNLFPDCQQLSEWYNFDIYDIFELKERWSEWTMMWFDPSIGTLPLSLRQYPRRVKWTSFGIYFFEKFSNQRIALERAINFPREARVAISKLESKLLNASGDEVKRIKSEIDDWSNYGYVDNNLIKYIYDIPSINESIKEYWDDRRCEYSDQ